MATIKRILATLLLMAVIGISAPCAFADGDGGIIETPPGETQGPPGETNGPPRGETNAPPGETQTPPAGNFAWVLFQLLAGSVRW